MENAHDGKHCACISGEHCRGENRNSNLGVTLDAAVPVPLGANAAPKVKILET